MSIQRSRTNETDMSSAISLAQTLERRERRFLSASDARRSLARKLRLGVGTLENLVRGRVKRVDAAIRDRLQDLLVNELEGELARLTHELEMARQGGDHPASQHISAIETHLAQARALMNGNNSTAIEGVRECTRSHLTGVKLRSITGKSQIGSTATKISP